MPFGQMETLGLRDIIHDLARPHMTLVVMRWEIGAWKTGWGSRGDLLIAKFQATCAEWFLKSYKCPSGKNSNNFG